MNQLKIAGVVRSNQFSPNHIGNDAAIFQATAQSLRDLGCEVDVYTEEQFQKTTLYPDAIFSMGRQQATIAKLALLQEEGIAVINSAIGVKNCTRELMTRLLIEASIPHPRSLIVDTQDFSPEGMNDPWWFPCWIKRGDFHAIHREDVSFVRNKEELVSLVNEFALRGIPSAVINEHLRGDLVKFYGVANTPFFYWFYPFDMQHSKFGLEQINGVSKGYAFEENQLKSICDEAADTLQVSVYGGDCIVSVDGSIQIIDFNDWPSFAPCRDEAAPHIAQAICNQLKK